MNDKLDIESEIISLKVFLSRADIWYREDFDIKYETYFKCGGVVKVYVCPQDAERMKKVVRYLNNRGVAYKVIGFTSNIWLFDEIEYTVILSTKNMTGIKKRAHEIEVESGYPLQDFVRLAILESSGGFEGLEGIPGSVGGGVFMNAGAYGYVISKNIISVECVNGAGEIIILSKSDCSFEHRKSIFQSEGFVIISVRFEVKKGSSARIKDKVEAFHIARHSYQEFVYPNLGSMFSISGDPYGELLKHDRLLDRVMYYIYKVIYKNPVTKFMRRKRPRNTEIHRLFFSKFKATGYTPSSKSLNILINDGSASASERIKYIFEFEKRLGDRFNIENEMVIEPAYRVRSDFVEELAQIERFLSGQLKVL